MYRILRFMLLLLLLTTCDAIDKESQESDAHDKTKTRPNILLVMADDMGWTDLGAFGSEISTPNLDQLASEGAVFIDFHVSVSCSPTRSMLLTGNDNHIAGLGNMAELLTESQVGQPGYEGHVNDRVVTLAEVLGSGGYHTYIAGKWHLGHHEGSRPFDRGFEQSFSMLVGGASHWSDMLGILPRDDPAKYSQNGVELDKLPADFYSSRSYADHLMDMIRRNRDDGKPFFAYLAFTAPHDPLHVPEPWLSKYKGQYDEGYEKLKNKRFKRAKELGLIDQEAQLAEIHPMIKPWSELTDDERALEARGMEVYAGMLEAMDYNYGRVINFLKDIGEYDNTIIVFLSDNGPNPWYSADYPEATKPEFSNQFDNSVENIGHPRSNYAYGIGFGSASAGPLDRFKMTVGEGGVRSPLLIAGPGIETGKVIRSFAYITDVMPTILEFAEVEYPSSNENGEIQPIRGRSMMGLLNGSKSEIYSPDEYIGGEMGGGKWMRKGDLKAVLVPAPYGSGEWELYNVDTDPGESNDLSSELPDLLEELKKAWKEYSIEVGVVD